VLEGKEVQAVSTPGGFVFLTEGTVRKAKDEDELAAVLAHEIAHVSLKHGIGAIKAATRQKSIAILGESALQIGAAAAQGSGKEQLTELTAVFGDAINDITDELLVKGYSRDTELEADDAGAGYLQSSGYARSALSNFLDVLDKSGVGGEGGWGKTHPSPKDRMDNLVEKQLAAGSSPGRDVRGGRFQKAMGGA